LVKVPQKAEAFIASNVEGTRLKRAHGGENSFDVEAGNLTELGAELFNVAYGHSTAVVFALYYDDHRWFFETRQEHLDRNIEDDGIFSIARVIASFSVDPTVLRSTEEAPLIDLTRQEVKNLFFKFVALGVSA
jgi:hypothetical protein